MPNVAAVVLKDRLDADVTFNPRDVNGGVATLVSSTGVPVGDKRLTLSHTRTANGREKIVIKLAIPVVQDVVVAGVSRPTIVRAAYADMTFSVDQTSGTNERADLLAAAKSFLGHATAIGLIRDLEALY